MTDKYMPYRNLLSHLILIVAAVVLMFPFVWMLSGSFKDNLEVVRMPPNLIPDTFKFSNYVEITKYFPIYRFLGNSVGVSIVTTAAQIVVCAMAAFVFAKIPFRGRETLFVLYLITMMIPMQVTMTPLFIVFQKLHLTNTYLGLILPGIFSAYGTFLLRQHIMTIPDPLIEAARMDGASYLRVFVSIILPLSKPALATLAIFAFMASWNNFLWPLIITSDKELMTLPIGLSKLQGRWATEWNILMAGNVISFIPIFIVFLFASKYFIKGMTMSGVKG
ncbi:MULTISPECIES: carbohydrate ABC transporter permease [unclassified Paenibacillus]|jgi:multiple sugar transport system permease protein|uniref:carbohydrate ABC transporter permease n=1 Tax=unclassified Paenibacillus TaxID=185978 RepID=UPI00278ABFB0|nr:MULTISPECIES: carbohydrate ABC transporter permease [unclassified Paenibacillus]MDF2646276.1 sugar transporter permease [Paenibacillus sp.]MDQ0900229.1 multiple sugar transport system permease protein [Paenibacillus sp. V4I7]MDQ0921259.1 multiple sugar transport system permease protein [Paenibacillus sp. V4I5]